MMQYFVYEFDLKQSDTQVCIIIDVFHANNPHPDPWLKLAEVKGLTHIETEHFNRSYIQLKETHLLL